MAVALFFYGGGRTLREALLSNFITDQYDIGKLEEVIKVFLELIDTAVLKLADEDYYIKITQNYEMKFTGGQKSITSSKIESFLIDKYDSDEKLKELLYKCSKSFNCMSKLEREFFSKIYINLEKKTTVINEMSLHQYQYEQLKKSSIVKFCLVLGLDKFMEVI